MRISLLKFWIIISVVYCAVVTVIEFAGVPVSSLYSVAVTGMQFMTVAVCTSGLLLLLSSYRVLFAALFPLLALISGVMSFFSLTIGTRLTPVSIELALINDA